MPECGCNCCTFCSLLLLFAGATAGAIIYQDRTGNTIPGIGDRLPNITEVKDAVDNIKWPDLDFDFDGDFSSEGDDAGNFTLDYAWDFKKDEGLKLNVINALTEDWHSYFDQAIIDWENGSPDVITLETSVIDADPDCTPVSNKMKVCNRDYGETGWEGINEILTQGRTIVSSVAKMNEFYLSRDKLTEKNEFVKRQYTMCHEIGHGYGLPHLDENFQNADLNSCMDYSSRPENNQVPNAQDYENLNILYGNERIRQRQRFLRHSLKHNLDGKMVVKHVFYLPARG